jgi:hypothetical protein
MPLASLTPHDIHVLRKIKDPESTPSAPVLIDDSLARDPHITNPADYESVTSWERQIISAFQNLEREIAARAYTDEVQISTDYDTCTANLTALSVEYPSYASAHNNKAQALRRKFGDSVLLQSTNPLPGLFTTRPLNDEEVTGVINDILTSLETAIALLSPPTTFAPISPQAAKTLSQAYTQRGALYYATAKQLVSDPDAKLRVSRDWTREDLEEMASRDFMMGGRYGNEIARGLAMATNPTAKLCGSIVREAMRKEFDGVPS